MNLWHSRIKIFMLAIILMLLFIDKLWAAPFLVSDPMPNTVEKIEVDFGNGLIPDAVTVTLEDLGETLRIHHDLVSLPENQAYTARARAYYGVWGWSPWSDPFDFTKPSLASPFGVGLSED